jgi:hypothetical protein
LFDHVSPQTFERCAKDVEPERNRVDAVLGVQRGIAPLQRIVRSVPGDLRQPGEIAGFAGWSIASDRRTAGRCITGSVPDCASHAWPAPLAASKSWPKPASFTGPGEIAASISPLSSSSSSVRPSTRDALGGSATPGSGSRTVATHCTRLRSTPKSCVRMPASHGFTGLVQVRTPIRFPARSAGVAIAERFTISSPSGTSVDVMTGKPATGMPRSAAISSELGDTSHTS